MTSIKIYGEDLKTERTILRKLTVNDAEFLYALNLDQEVLRFTGDKPFNNIEQARQFILHYDQYKKYGVGRLAVIEKTTGKIIGWCGLKYNEDINEYDIGFRFFRENWNKGFATETAKCCIQYGVDLLGINKIVGRVMKQNTASIKVLIKSGLQFKETFDFSGEEGLIFELIHHPG